MDQHSRHLSWFMAWSFFLMNAGGIMLIKASIDSVALTQAQAWASARSERNAIKTEVDLLKISLAVTPGDLLPQMLEIKKLLLETNTYPCTWPTSVETTPIEKGQKQ